MNKILSLGAILLIPLFAHAVELSDTSKVVDLDEVVVVSQPKDGRLLRRQPLSSTVLTQREMRQLKVSDLSELSVYVPSFVMPQYGSRLTSALYVRGIGARINNPAVGIYYDNVPLMGKSAFNHHFYMIDRVDVLRGPQSTLYGMNTEGGLVRIYSKNPMDYQGTDLSMGIGTGLTGHAEVAHFHRPSDQFAFSAAAFYNGQRGFFKNQALNEWNDKLNEAGGKMRFVWQPTQRLKLDLTADYQYTNQNAFPYGLYDIDQNTVADPSTTVMNGYKRQMVNTGLNIGYDGGKWLLSSVTSWQYLRDHMEMDQDYVTDDYMHLTQIQKQQALTQELTVRSKRQGSWQWTFGVFGSHQWLRTDVPVGFGPTMNQQTANRILALMPPAVANMFTTWEIPDFYVNEVFHTPASNLGLFHESTLSLGNRFDITLGLRYDYSHVKIDYETSGMLSLHYAMPAMPPRMPRAVDQTNMLTASMAHSASRSFHQLLPKIGLTYHVDQQGSNIYATVAKGYRAGGYNIQMFSDIYQTEFMNKGKMLSSGDVVLSYDEDTYQRINDNISYKPEESWNFEMGTHLNLFDGKVKADAAVYYMYIRNQQLSVMADDYNFGRVMVNAGKSSSCGLELALRGKAMDNRLNWSATYSFTHATFREYQDSVKVGNVKTLVNYKDNHVPFVPQHTFSLSADYRFPVDAQLVKSITVGANVTGQGKVYWDEANSYAQKFYALIGVHADVELGKSVIVSLWGRNLTDTKYNQFAIKSKATGEELTFAQRGNPLECGLGLYVHF